MNLEILNTDNLCPNCRGSYFIIGPSGGMAVNIKCVVCGAKWWFAPPFTPERIENGDEFYTRAPVNLKEFIEKGEL